MNTIASIWKYRSFISGSIQREFQNRYQNSLLGATWSILHPLSTILVYTLVFSQVMRSRIPTISQDFGYSIYLCSGILTWGLFSENINRSINLFTENANILKKLNFPKICLPIITTITSIINFLVVFTIFTLFLILSHNFPISQYVAIIPLIAIILLLSLGLGISLAVFNVFFRDVGHLFSIILQFWFWLTPIVYPISAIPNKLQWILQLNPMTPVIESFQMILVHSQWPNWNNLIYPAIAGLLSFLLGIHLFNKLSEEIIDEL